MKYEYASQTDIGLVRSNNEDAYLIDPDLNLFIVADGMGGYDKGEVASQMTCIGIAEHLRDIAKESSVISKNHLLDSIQKTNDAIRKKIRETENLEKMGSTVVSLLIRQDKLLILNVGDSRAYRLRNKKLQQISVDHSLVEEIRAANIKKEFAFQFKNVVTRAMGMKDTVNADIFSETLQKRDIFLLCSDGLHGFVSDEVIENVLVNTQENSLQTQINELVDKAKKAGGKDNITGILIQILEIDPTDSSLSIKLQALNETFQIPAYALKIERDSFFSPLQTKILLTALTLVVFWIVWSFCH